MKFITIFLILLVSISLCIQSNQESYTGFVARVIDGDTIDLDTGERIRLIGINTPDFGEDCYEEATEKLKGLILNKSIKLESDIKNLDAYDRSLRYIYLGDMFVNFEMVRTGYAFAWNIEPNTKFSREIENAEIFAERNSLGCLWG